MPKITIDVEKYERLTKKSFVMKYLFQKGNGNRRTGEASTSELFAGWSEAAAQLGKKIGKVKSFQYEMWTLKDQGIVEVSRTEPGEKTIPRNYYILTEEYFRFMRSGGK